MKKILALVVLSMGVPAYASTYTIAAGSSTDAIQATLNAAGSGPGNTVVFSAGTYTLDYTLALPCSNGTVYTGPNVGVVTQNQLPKAVLTSTDPSNYAFSTDSNGSSLTASQGCTIEYLRFSGTQGGILVYYPASGITIQDNAFDNNNPPVGGSNSQANIYLTGENWEVTPDAGINNITVVWNVFFNNCAAIRAAGTTDSGGGCSATWVDGYNNYLTWSNNTVNLTEEGLKLSAEKTAAIASLNLDVENNNMQGNSRILIEAQQDTNGMNVYSHNAFYQPNDPGFNTYELSIPQWLNSIPPTQTVSDNVFIGNVPINMGGSGAHYGIGVELWGPGSITTNNLFQGGNGPDTCAAGWGCSGWGVSVGEPFTNATITGNYFSGTDVWNGSSTDVSNAVTYEDGGSTANAGLILSPNTVVQTSTTIPMAAPTIKVAGSVITLSNANAVHSATIFYTTDGTNPAIFGPGQSAGTTRVYAAPFTLAAGGMVKAVASWGRGANQGIVFPSFGYVPSNIVTATVSGSSAGVSAPATSESGPTLVSAYLGNKGSANSMAKGGTLQFTAYGVYSDGSVHSFPNALTTEAVNWNTSNHAVAKVSSKGRVTAMGTGKVDVKATIGSLPASPWTVAVGGATPAVRANVQANAEANSVPASSVAVANSNPPATANVQASTAGLDSPPAPPASAGENPASPGTPSVPPASGPSAPLPGPVAGGPVPASPSTALPDNFLGPFWTVQSPAGGMASISGSHLFIGVPGGSNHDPLIASNQAVRVVQAIGSQDFDVAIKIDSPLFATDANTSQGLMMLSDNSDFITFALTTDGSKIGLSAHTVLGGAASIVLEDTDLSSYQNPMYLRLTKAGSSYVGYYSTDGANWVQATNFTYTKAPSQIGAFASNYSDNPAQAVPVVMAVNWFDVQQ